MSRGKVLIGIAVFLTIINVVSCYRSHKIVITPDKAHAKFLEALEQDSEQLIDLLKQYDQAKAKLFDAMLEDLVRESKDGKSKIEELEEEKRLIVGQLKRSEKLINFYRKRFNDLLRQIRAYRS